MHQTILFILLLVVCVLSYAKENIDIKISGVKGELADNVRLFLSIEQQKSHPLLSESRIRRLHKKATQEIKSALEPFGYYRPKIETDLWKDETNQWHAHYTIDPGAPIKIEEFDLQIRGEIESDIEFRAYLKKLPLAVGKTFNHRKYEETKSTFTRLAVERGYVNARFVEHRVEVDLDTYQARVHLHYESGPRFHFGEVQLKQDVLNTDLLRRYLPFRSGDPYSLADLLDLQQALNDSDYFGRVEVTSGEPQQEDLSVPIVVALSPRKRHRYGFGLGYGTDTGARARFTWDIPRINRRGHRFDSESRISQIGLSVSAQYLVPVFNPRTDQVSYKAALINENTDTTDSSVRTFGAGINHSRGAWRESITLDFQHESYRIADTRDTSKLLIPGISWTRVWGKREINTRDGLRFQFSVRGARSEFISDSSFVQARADVKAIKTFTAYNRIVFRGTTGATLTNEFDRLPSSVRFFAGGAQSVRGFGYQTLGPRNEQNKVVGGRHLLIGSVEFERRIYKKWGAAVFYDIGNAIDNPGDKLEHGAGVGVRWQSPVGPVRIDLASAIRHEGYPLRIHLNVGPDL